MRTSNLLPEECKEEIRARMGEILGEVKAHFEKYGHAPYEAKRREYDILKWVLGDDGK